MATMRNTGCGAGRQSHYLDSKRKKGSSKGPGLLCFLQMSLSAVGRVSSLYPFFSSVHLTCNTRQLNYACFWTCSFKPHSIRPCFIKLIPAASLTNQAYVSKVSAENRNRHLPPPLW